MFLPKNGLFKVFFFPPKNPENLMAGIDCSLLRGTVAVLSVGAAEAVGFANEGSSGSAKGFF